MFYFRDLIYAAAVYVHMRRAHSYNTKTQIKWLWNVMRTETILLDNNKFEEHYYVADLHDKIKYIVKNNHDIGYLMYPTNNLPIKKNFTCILHSYGNFMQISWPTRGARKSATESNKYHTITNVFNRFFYREIGEKDIYNEISMHLERQRIRELHRGIAQQLLNYFPGGGNAERRPTRYPNIRRKPSYRVVGR